MRIRVEFGGPLRDVTGGLAALDLEVPDGTREALEDELSRRFAGIGTILFDETGRVRKYVSAYHNGQGLSDGQLTTRLVHEDVVRFTMLVSGG